MVLVILFTWLLDLCVRWGTIIFNEEAVGLRWQNQTALWQKSNRSFGFSSSHVWMWEFDHKESWPSNNWYFWTVMLEKTLESALDSKEVQPVHPKGNQSWMFFGRTDVEVEAPILWPHDAKSWLIGKDPDPGQNWRQEETGTTEDEIVGGHELVTEVACRYSPPLTPHPPRKV